MSGLRVRLGFAVLGLMVLATLFVARDAHAQNGSWTWGPPGFSNGWSQQQRADYLISHGLADPNASYWTPFWSGEHGSVYTGVTDTSFRNGYSVNHDINSAYGIPLIGYIDVFTPLFGTNELEIGIGLGMLWNSIVDTVSNLWNSFTDLFRSDYTSYNSTGSYPSGWDNAFTEGYGGYGSYGGGGSLSCDSCHM